MHGRSNKQRVCEWHHILCPYHVLVSITCGVAIGSLSSHRVCDLASLADDQSVASRVFCFYSSFWHGLRWCCYNCWYDFVIPNE